MHTFSDMAQLLNESAVNLSRLQKRFELPAFEGPGYSEAYLILLRKLTALRIFGISEDTLLKLWLLEKKLMQLLHADAFHSPTWFLDCCSANRFAGYCCPRSVAGSNRDGLIPVQPAIRLRVLI
jgi:hypothetical protein